MLPTVTLKLLLELQLVQANDSFTIIYGGQRYRAVITEEGALDFDGLIFETPSGWALHVIRLTNPNRRAVDGWRCVQYKGRVLSYYMDAAKRQMLMAYGEQEFFPHVSHASKPNKRQKVDKHSDNEGHLAGSTSTQSYVEPSSSGDEAAHHLHHIMHAHTHPMPVPKTQPMAAHRAAPRPQHRRKGRPQSAL